MDWKTIAFEVFGGLGLFLLGMKIMSEGMQKVAGDRLRKVLGFLTQNRFMAILVGMTVTAVIQSSSATTVMTVGFVNAQLMTLTQAIGVILGANIGTTVTGWLVS
nr:Na/Pi symporter [bacterium]